jgi:FG-GAP-like repeat
MYYLLIFLAFGFLSCTKADVQQEPAESPAAWVHLTTADGSLPVPGTSDQQTASLVLDIDMDGLNDFVIGCRHAPPSMIWYRRNAGGWDRLVIDPTIQAVEAGGTSWDIDGDGDPDIVMAGDASSNKVWWWENPYPDYSESWTRREIKSSGDTKHHDQIFGDFDGDGSTELLFWNQNTRALFRADIPENPLNSEPWQIKEIYSWLPDDKYAANEKTPRWMDNNEHEGMAAVDIDGDGITDLVGGGRWFKFNSDGKVKVHVIDPTQHFTRAAAGQLIEGGRPEVIFVIGDGLGPIKCYEWKGSRWVGRDLLGHDVRNGHSLQVVDLNGDGNLDVFCAEMRLNGSNPAAKIYAFLGDGAGHFSTRIIADGFGNHESKVADLDGDGDMDILGKPYNWLAPRLDIWLNGGEGFTADSLHPFERIVIDEDGPADPHTKTAGDIDGDGVEDLIICSSAGGPLVWYRSPDWSMHEVAPSGKWSCDAEVADMNGDGDNDIIISEYYGKEIMEWYENPGTAKDAGKWKLHEIGPPRAHDVEIADFDKDGKPDILVRGQSGFGTEEGNRIVVLYQDDRDKWTSRSVECPHGEGLDKGDIDRDGFVDAVIGGKWYRNPGTRDGSWQEIDFTGWHYDAVVRVADINGDGSLDAVCTEAETTGEIAWFESPGDVAGGAWTKHVIGRDLEKGHSLAVADLDGDGDIDVATAEMHQSVDPDYVLAFINKGGGLEWQRREIGTTGSHGIRLGDFDGDGDIDIFGANWKSVAYDSLTYVEIYRNNTGSTGRLSLDRWQRHVLDGNKPWRAVFIGAADLDGDGLKDVATGGWWYRNPGNNSGNWQCKSLGAPLNNMAVIGDFSGDGLPDILGTTGKGAEASAQFVWALNRGKGKFEIQKNIPEARGDFLQGVEFAEVYPGGPQFVALSWHQADQGIQAFVIPDDPISLQWEWMQVTQVSQDEQLSVGDIDNDGDVDLLLGTLWLENQAGSPGVSTLFETSGSPDRNRLADIDGDGRLDAVVGYEAINVPGKLAWYKNPADSRDSWTEHVIAEVVGPMSLDVADMDGDGDIDVVVGEHNYEKPETARLLVLENLDGRGASWRTHLVYTGDEHHDGAILTDIDSDGDLDVISIGWSHSRVLLYENKAL